MSTLGSCTLSKRLEGCRVRLRAGQSQIEGTVQCVNLKTSRISLKKIDNSTSQKPSIMHFYADEITSCVVLENSTKQEGINSKEEEGGPRLLRVRPIPLHLERLNTSLDARDYICHRLDSDDENEEIKRGNIKLNGEGNQIPTFKYPLPSKFQLIDEMDETFQEALDALKKQRVIGIGYYGFNIGRNGCLSIFVVSTAETVYLFDILVLKDEPFDQGLKDILESKEIEKVVHGCRQISDCLYHNFGVNLDNIFDTQVADVLMFRNINRGADETMFVRGLQHCMRAFLGISQEQMKYVRPTQTPEEEDTSAWRQRPLSLSQIDNIVKGVVYLRELREGCLNRLLRDFHNGVRYFQHFVRDCSEQELELIPPDHVLPSGFYKAIRPPWKSQDRGRESTGHNGYRTFDRQERGYDHIRDGGRQSASQWGRPKYYNQRTNNLGGRGGGRFRGSRHSDVVWHQEEEPQIITAKASSFLPDPEDSLFLMPPTPPHESATESDACDSAATESQHSTQSESHAEASSQSSWEVANSGSSNVRNIKFVPAGMVLP